VLIKRTSVKRAALQSSCAALEEQNQFSRSRCERGSCVRFTVVGLLWCLSAHVVRARWARESGTKTKKIELLSCNAKVAVYSAPGLAPSE
jgi:hypothetical protein